MAQVPTLSWVVPVASEVEVILCPSGWGDGLPDAFERSKRTVVRIHSRFASALQTSRGDRLRRMIRQGTLDRIDQRMLPIEFFTVSCFAFIAATIAGFAFSPMTASVFPEITTAIAHLRDVLGD